MRRSSHRYLVVVGEGGEEKKLKRIASENVIFLSRLTDQELGFIYTKAEALVMPQEEDFGYTSLEAQFFGCPVIAYKKGGATETIIENRTGIFFQEQTENSLLDGLKKFDVIKYQLKQSTKEYGSKNMEQFSLQNFKNAFTAYLNSALKDKNVTI